MGWEIVVVALVISLGLWRVTKIVAAVVAFFAVVAALFHLKTAYGIEFRDIVSGLIPFLFALAAWGFYEERKRKRRP
jgi:hypothetical protein